MRDLDKDVNWRDGDLKRDLDLERNYSIPVYHASCNICLHLLIGSLNLYFLTLVLSGTVVLSL